MGQVVRLLVADAHPAVADGLGMLLAGEDDFRVCGVAHDGATVVELRASLRPHLLVLDGKLAGGDPATTPAAVKAASPTTKVVVVLAGSSPSVAAAGLGGADGVVATDGSSRQLAAVIRRVVVGGQALVALRGSPHPHGHDHGQELELELLRLWTLSGREREALGLVAHGWSNRRIAHAWQVSPATVRSHVQHLLDKLDLHSKLEAAAFAWKHRIVAADAIAGGEPTT